MSLHVIFIMFGDSAIWEYFQAKILSSFIIRMYILILLKFRVAYVPFLVHKIANSLLSGALS